MVAQGEEDVDPHTFAEGPLNPGCELGSLIKYYVLWKAIVPEHMVVECLEHFHSCGKALDWYHSAGYRERVYCHQDGGMAVRAE